MKNYPRFTSDEEVRDFIIDRYNYFKFKLPLDYKVAAKKFERGERKKTNFPEWALIKRTYSLTGYDTPAKKAIYTDDLLRVREFIDIFLNKLEELCTSGSRIEFNSKLKTTKTRDGQGTASVAAAASWYEFKDSKSMDRYVRKETKDIINYYFKLWLSNKNESKGKLNTQLPSKLLEDMIERKTEWDTFCEELLKIRLGEE